MAQNPSDYLILQNIDSYKFITQSKNPITKKVKTIDGYWIFSNSGSLMGTGHFVLDHDDKTYETVYESDVTDLGVKVQVTQHTGGDSDRWLLHEIEDGFRRSKTLKATYSAPNPIRIIDNNTIWFQWGVYTWLSNNIVVKIEYTDLQGTKPEPLEVVKAYLAKFPSTITLTNADAKASAHNIQWIKDEIDRRLWLCDKWNAQFQSGGVTQADLIYNLVRSIKVFLNYRQKYFGESAADELAAIGGYNRNNDLASIQTKLTQYKTWWNANKGKSITLP